MVISTWRGYEKCGFYGMFSRLAMDKFGDFLWNLCGYEKCGCLVKFGNFYVFLDEQPESFHVASLFFVEQTRFFFEVVC